MPLDRELLDIVASDLRFLEEEWDSEVDEHSLRRSSTVLRTLLVEDLLGKAWREIGRSGQPEIEAIDLAASLTGLDIRRVKFATAGGGESGGVFVAGALLYEGTPSGEERGSEPPTRTFRLSEFLRAPSVVVDGKQIKRRDVVKYVANKLGGGHFDRRRKQSDEAFRLLDNARSSFEVAGKNLVYFELVSIGQAVARAESTRELRELVGAL